MYSLCLPFLFSSSSLISPKFISWVAQCIVRSLQEGMRAWLSPGHIRAEKPLDSCEILCNMPDLYAVSEGINEVMCERACWCVHRQPFHSWSGCTLSFSGSVMPKAASCVRRVA